MREWLNVVSEPAIAVIDAIALLVILVGTFEVVAVYIVRAVFKPLPNDVARAAWVRYARWLVAALTFQLAADIIETSISTNWQTIGRVAAVAVIRTFLNYFLERDVQQQQRDAEVRAPGNEPPRRSGV
jgi:uncharacterized membrane protein